MCYLGITQDAISECTAWCGCVIFSQLSKKISTVDDRKVQVLDFMTLRQVYEVGLWKWC